MRGSRARRLLLIGILSCGIRPAYGAGAAAPETECRESQRRSDAWRKHDDTGRLERTRDVDGDGVPDRLSVVEVYGNAYGQTEVELQLSSTKKRVRVTAGGGFDTLVSYIPVPSEAADDPAVRKALEDALFDKICSAPEPSLAWLLDARHALRWHDGTPVLPDAYAIYSVRPEVIAQVRGAPRAVWVQYWGHNHGRGGPAKGAAAGDILQPPRELARSAERVLLATSHGAILAEPAHDRFAWIYVVARSREKLRFPSVLSGQLLGDTAVLETTGGAVRIDLRSGAVLAEGRPAP